MNQISVSGKNWILKKFNNDDIDFYKNNFFLDEITSKLLSIRNIEKTTISNFLNPSIKNSLPDPNLLKDMDKATERTVKAIIKNEKIAIFGDYDVDGATSTALLGNYLKSINHIYEIYIPDRKLEGYGPNISGFQKLIESNSKLIFTVDCGTLSFKPIEFAQTKNVDVIVLDHHQSEISLPKAYSVVNPNRYDDKSNLNYLCAAGVSFMFLVSLNKKLRELNWFKNKKVKEPNLIDFLDLVSLGTVCDVVPLIGLNRTMVKQGLKVLKNKKNLGLKTLFEMCKINTNPTSYHLGFVIGPRINAGGRVGKCSHGANLLLNLNSKESFKLATELNEYNNERKDLEKKFLNAALDVINYQSNDPIIIILGKNWHEGVIGIVASRIKDRFNKPTIIISTNKNIGKASARSITGFDIGSVIIAALQKKLITKGGGHKMAAGFSIEMSKIDKFKEFIFKKFLNLNKKMNSTAIYLDSEISPSALNIDFFEKINILSPFGAGNPEPRFLLRDLKVLNSKIVGEKHVKSVLLGKDGSSIQTISFNSNSNEIGQFLLNNNKDLFSIVGKLSLNEWNGRRNVEFIIDDISVTKNQQNKTVPSSIG
tara:strand:- start:3591 stop:5375 length:1785 start_codon:yes stop_codon:yes gene_type:complete